MNLDDNDDAMLCDDDDDDDEDDHFQKHRVFEIKMKKRFKEKLSFSVEMKERRKLSIL